MKKKYKIFTAFYLVWSVINLTLMILAMSSVFGTSNKTMTEFWPFTVGSLRYYDFYELLVYLGLPLIIFFVYRAGQSKRFWIPYIIWGVINITLMFMAISDVFGTSVRTVKEFWPFSEGELKFYDLLELVVYLVIPLIIYYLYCLVQSKEQSTDGE